VDNQPKKKRPNKWFAFINIPIQMGAIIYAFSFLGNWLDDHYPNEHNIYVKGLTLLGVALAFYNLNRQLKEINSDQE